MFTLSVSPLSPMSKAVSKVECFVACAPGVESALRAELRALRLRPATARAERAGSTLLLPLRCASRRPLADGDRGASDRRAPVCAIAWL